MSSKLAYSNFPPAHRHLRLVHEGELWGKDSAQSGPTRSGKIGDGRQMLTDHCVDEQNCALLRPLEDLPGEGFELKVRKHRKM